MKDLDQLLAEKLLSISAIKLQPSNFIKVELSRLIAENSSQAEVVAGVATGAIAQGALVADTLSLPFVYIRSTPKDHGLENLIEGNIKPGQKVVIVEDLVSTGKSSLKAAQAVRDAGAEVIGMVAIFTYEFPQAAEAFKQAGIQLLTISNYTAMVDAAVKAKYIKPEDVETLKQWREDPANWTPNKVID